jgi:hypothetical protein
MDTKIDEALETERAHFLQRLGKRISFCSEELERSKGVPLAKQTGISPSSYLDYIAGRVEPRLMQLMLIAKEAAVNLAWLQTGEGPMRPGVCDYYSVPKEDFFHIPILTKSGEIDSQTAWGYVRRDLLHNCLPELPNMGITPALFRVTESFSGPKFIFGEFLLVDTTPGIPLETGDYILKQDGNAVVRQITVRPNKRILMLSPTNGFGVAVDAYALSDFQSLFTMVARVLVAYKWPVFCSGPNDKLATLPPQSAISTSPV